MKKLSWLVFLLVGLLALQSPPAMAAAALVSHKAFTPSAGNTNGGTTVAIDTSTGSANFIAIAVSNAANTTPAVSDSATNTWYLASAHNDGGNFAQSRLYYCISCNVSATHTFTVTGTGQAISFVVAAFSGMSPAPLDRTAIAASGCSSCTTLAFGSITPANNNSLVLSALLQTSTSTVTGATPNGGFTVADQVFFLSGTNYGSSLGYLIQTTATAANPTWTMTGAGTLYMGGSNVAFKDSSATATMYSSKIVANQVLTTGADSAMSASKIVANQVLTAGTDSAMSASKIEALVILQATRPAGFFHSVPAE